MGAGRGKQVVKVTWRKASFACAAPTLSLCPLGRARKLQWRKLQTQEQGHRLSGPNLRHMGSIWKPEQGKVDADVYKVNKVFALKAAFDAQLRFGV